MTGNIHPFRAALPNWGRMTCTTVQLDVKSVRENNSKGNSSFKS